MSAWRASRRAPHPHSTSHTTFRSRITVVPRINALCGRLALLRHTLDLQRTHTDLNALISTTLTGLKSSLRAPLIQGLYPVPGIHLDPDQMHEVLVNLVLHADQAVDDGA